MGPSPTGTGGRVRVPKTGPRGTARPGATTRAAPSADCPASGPTCWPRPRPAGSPRRLTPVRGRPTVPGARVLRSPAVRALVLFVRALVLFVGAAVILFAVAHG